VHDQARDPANAWRLALALAGQLDAEGVLNLVTKERGRPVVVNFWATWYEPCRAELPELAVPACAHPEIAWLSVSIDDQSDRPAVEALIAALRPPFPVYLKAVGPDQAFIEGIDKKWSGVVPMTLVFDTQGQRVARLAGEHGHAEIERALAGLAQAGMPPPAAGVAP
jgi:thiol-disulfide isomerase/thioredoxin